MGIGDAILGGIATVGLVAGGYYFASQYANGRKIEVIMPKIEMPSFRLIDPNAPTSNTTQTSNVTTSAVPSANTSIDTRVEECGSWLSKNHIHKSNSTEGVEFVWANKAAEELFDDMLYNTLSRVWYPGNSQPRDYETYKRDFTQRLREIRATLEDTTRADLRYKRCATNDRVVITEQAVNSLAEAYQSALSKQLIAPAEGAARPDTGGDQYSQNWNNPHHAGFNRGGHSRARRLDDLFAGIFGRRQYTPGGSVAQYHAGRRW